MKERIALFGGTFDPIHVGHLITARSVAECLSVARLVLLPSACPPHKDDQSVTPAAHRLEMVRLAIANEPGLEVSDCEIHRPGPSYTIDTIQAFRQSCGPDTELYWIIGADSLGELAGWHRVHELVRMCRIITASRPGFDQPDLSGLRVSVRDEDFASLREGILETPRIDISSTELRKRVRSGASIRYYVPEPVRAYILTNRLYSS